MAEARNPLRLLEPLVRPDGVARPGAKGRVARAASGESGDKAIGSSPPHVDFQRLLDGALAARASGPTPPEAGRSTIEADPRGADGGGAADTGRSRETDSGSDAGGRVGARMTGLDFGALENSSVRSMLAERGTRP